MSTVRQINPSPSVLVSWLRRSEPRTQACADPALLPARRPFASPLVSSSPRCSVKWRRPCAGTTTPRASPHAARTAPLPHPPQPQRTAMAMRCAHTTHTANAVKLKDNRGAKSLPSVAAQCEAAASLGLRSARRSPLALCPVCALLCAPPPPAAARSCCQSHDRLPSPHSLCSLLCASPAIPHA